MSSFIIKFPLQIQVGRSWFWNPGPQGQSHRALMINAQTNSVDSGPPSSPKWASARDVVKYLPWSVVSEKGIGRVCHFPVILISRLTTVSLWHWAEWEKNMGNYFIKFSFFLRIASLKNFSWSRWYAEGCIDGHWTQDWCYDARRIEKKIVTFNLMIRVLIVW